MGIIVAITKRLRQTFIKASPEFISKGYKLTLTLHYDDKKYEYERFEFPCRLLIVEFGMGSNRHKILIKLLPLK